MTVTVMMVTVMVVTVMAVTVMVTVNNDLTRDSHRLSEYLAAN